jgi:hypothetical protein
VRTEGLLIVFAFLACSVSSDHTLLVSQSGIFVLNLTIPFAAPSSGKKNFYELLLLIWSGLNFYQFTTSNLSGIGIIEDVPSCRPMALPR